MYRGLGPVSGRTDINDTVLPLLTLSGTPCCGTGLVNKRGKVSESEEIVKTAKLTNNANVQFRVSIHSVLIPVKIS